MTALQIVTSVASAVAVILGAIATYRSSRAQQKKLDNDRYESYTTRIETRLKDVETDLRTAKTEIEDLKRGREADQRKIESLEKLREFDTRWKRVATRHIEALHDYIQLHLGSIRDDIPGMPQELTDNLD